MPQDSMSEGDSSSYPANGPVPAPVNITISWSAQFRLERLASYYNLTNSQMLNHLITLAHQNILSTLSDSQTEEYLYKRLSKI
ncbi:hypothetical protein F9C28_04285 [Shimwellia pseudoproteus]|uniref:hypothetical protein n=1 Tax=Shimwellia pseudoproteus TaxID=570012 RepID=UPI0018EDFFD4|nr:hypothetical protein [Shimwellia pseudoproteus]MBJ3814171.1 hypothetical protein [Shimwellia pseudoproteus]